MKSTLWSFLILLAASAAHSQTSPAASEAARPAPVAAEAAAAPAPAPEKKPDVIFVPTPQAVVDEMLRMAEIGPKDVIYDLGCGDGRIVVTAA